MKIRVRAFVVNLINLNLLWCFSCEHKSAALEVPSGGRGDSSIVEIVGDLDKVSSYAVRYRDPLRVRYGEIVYFIKGSDKLFLKVEPYREDVFSYKCALFVDGSLKKVESGELFEKYEKNTGNDRVVVRDDGGRLFIKVKGFSEFEWSISDESSCFIYPLEDIKYGKDLGIVEWK